MGERERERERESEAAASKEDRRPAAAPDRPKLSALSLARKKRRHLVVSGKKARGKLAWLRPKLRNRMGEIIPNTSSEFAPLLNFPNSVISSGGHFDREGAPHIQPPSVQECRLHCRRDLRHLAGDFPQILLLLRPSARPLAVYQLRSSQTCNVAHSARQNLVRNAQSLKMPIAVGRGQTDRRTRDLPPPPSIYMIPSGGAGSGSSSWQTGRQTRGRRSWSWVFFLPKSMELFQGKKETANFFHKPRESLNNLLPRFFGRHSSGRPEATRKGNARTVANGHVGP